MSCAVSTVWEHRADGANDNGGGYSAVLGGATGVDYSQQAAAQLSISDGSTNTGTTALTSVTGGFTVAMVGNVISVTQAAIFRGFFQITAWVSTNQVTLDRVGAVTAANCTVKVGGAHLISQNGFPFVLNGGASVAIPGQLAWVKAGTYSISANTPGSASIAGTSSQPFVVKGYNTTRGDLDGVNGTRPKLNYSASTINMLALDVDYWAIRNLEFDSTGNDLAVCVFTGSHCIVENCKLTTGTNGRAVTMAGFGNRFVRNYCIVGTGTVGTAGGISIQGTGGHLVEFNHFRGSGSPSTSNGVNCVVNGSTVRNNVIQKFVAGVMLDNATAVSGFIDHNIIHRCTNGIESNHASEHIGGFLSVSGNIISRCTRGIYDAISDISLNTGAINWGQVAFDCNYFYGNTTDHVNLPSGTGDVVLTADPFTNETTYDFSLNSATGGGQTVRDGDCEIVFADGINTSNQIAGIVSCPPTSSDADTTGARSIWREYTNERDTTVVPDATVDIYLDAGLQALNRRVYYHLTDSTTDVVLVAGTQEYTLPSDCVMIAWVEWNGKELTKASTDEWRNRGIDWRNAKRGAPLEWAMVKNKLIVYPTPDAAAVATAPSPVFRYVSSPPSITTNGPEQLATQDHRVAVIYGVAEFSTAHPDSALAIARSEGFMQRFDHEVEMIRAQYAARSVQR